MQNLLAISYCLCLSDPTYNNIPLLHDTIYKYAAASTLIHNVTDHNFKHNRNIGFKVLQICMCTNM